MILYGIQVYDRDFNFWKSPVALTRTETYRRFGYLARSFKTFDYTEYAQTEPGSRKEIQYQSSPCDCWIYREGGAQWPR